jgi:adenylosuccinate synthase
VNGLTELTITKLDVLDPFDEIKVCTGYEIDGEETSVYPLDTRRLARATPIYESLEGWNSSTRDCNKLDDLPANARHYVDYLEDYLNVDVKYISTGPRRTETVQV